VRLVEHQLLYLFKVDGAYLHALRRNVVAREQGLHEVRRDEAVADAIHHLHSHALAHTVLRLAAELPERHHEVSHHCKQQENLDCYLHD